jgi:hypothetical protein
MGIVDRISYFRGILKERQITIVTYEKPASLSMDLHQN